MTKKEFGRRISAFRKAKNLTQQAMADQLGCRQSSFSGYEKGDSWPPFDTIVDIAKALGVTLDDLAGIEAPTVAGGLRPDQRELIAVLEKWRHVNPDAYIDLRTLLTNAFVPYENILNQAKSAQPNLQEAEDKPVLRGLDNAETPRITVVPIEDRPIYANFRSELHQYKLVPAARGTPAAKAWYQLAAGTGSELLPMDNVYAIAAPGMKSAQLAKISGESMMETLLNDDLVVIEPINKGEGAHLSPLEDGQPKGDFNAFKALVPDRSIVVCARNGNPPTCKRIKYFGTAKDWYIQIIADNPNTNGFPELVLPDDTFSVYAKVAGLGIKD